MLIAKSDEKLFFPVVPHLTYRWFVPWRTAIVFPADNLVKIDRFKQEAFLTCPSSQELDLHLDWFEGEDAADSLTHQFLSIKALWQEEQTINFNASISADPIFKNAITTWKNSTDHSDKIPTTDESLWNLEFAPVPNQTVWQAWQIVVKTTHAKRCRHRRGLLSIYRQALQNQFFKDLKIEDNIKKAYLSRFENEVLGIVRKIKKERPGRWDQCQAIDRYSASAYIKYFEQKFLKEPDKKKFGEIASA
jgi:hypothetical protein